MSLLDELILRCTLMAWGAVTCTLLFNLFAERLWPAARGQGVFRRRQGGTDTMWFLCKTVLAFVPKLMFFAIIATPLSWLVGHDMGLAQFRSPAPLWPGSFIAQQPIALQIFESLLLQDFAEYWTHRLQHHPWFWRFHVIHHTAPSMDWRTNYRLHPFDGFVQLTSITLMVFVGTVLLGFSPEAVLPVLAARILMQSGTLNHANLRWSFGPLKYFLVSPVFHRWHHASNREAYDKNFGGTFSIWDWMFGTAYMPEGVIPQELGAPAPHVPESFIGQLIAPFRPTEAAPEPTTDAPERLPLGGRRMRRPPFAP
jgi:sterol desaturase/sphingolipid hydroxylase (fatty acid hydroxylase superfamily)